MLIAAVIVHWNFTILCRSQISGLIHQYVTEGSNSCIFGCGTAACLPSKLASTVCCFYCNLLATLSEWYLPWDWHNAGLEIVWYCVVTSDCLDVTASIGSKSVWLKGLEAEHCVYCCLHKLCDEMRVSSVLLDTILGVMRYHS